MRIGVIELVVLIVILVAILMVVVGNKKQGKSGRSSTNINQRGKSQQPTVMQQQGSGTNSKQKKVDLYSTLQYFVIIDKKIYGPLSLQQLKSYPLQEDTLVSTNTLGDKWYEAKYFECLDNVFSQNLPFRIDEDGVIIRG